MKNSQDKPVQRNSFGKLSLVSPLAVTPQQLKFTAKLSKFNMTRHHLHVACCCAAQERSLGVHGQPRFFECGDRRHPRRPRTRRAAGMSPRRGAVVRSSGAQCLDVSVKLRPSAAFKKVEARSGARTRRTQNRASAEARHGGVSCTSRQSTDKTLLAQVDLHEFC